MNASSALGLWSPRWPIKIRTPTRPPLPSITPGPADSFRELARNAQRHRFGRAPGAMALKANGAPSTRCVGFVPKGDLPTGRQQSNTEAALRRVGAPKPDSLAGAAGAPCRWDDRLRHRPALTCKPATPW